MSLFDGPTSLTKSLNDSDLICLLCNKVFSSQPVQLPCGPTVCKDHVQKYYLSKENILCPVCQNEDHPKYLIKTNKLVLKLASEKNFNFYFEKLDRLFNQVEMLNLLDLSIVVYDIYKQITGYVDIEAAEFLANVDLSFQGINSNLRKIEDYLIHRSDEVTEDLNLMTKEKNFLINSEISFEKKVEKGEISFDQHLFEMDRLNKFKSLIEKTISLNKNKIIRKKYLCDSINSVLKEKYDHLFVKIGLKNLFKAKPGLWNFICIDSKGTCRLYDFDLEKIVGYLRTDLFGYRHIFEDEYFPKINFKYVIKKLDDDKIVIAEDGRILSVWSLKNAKRIKQACVYKNQHESSKEIYKIIILPDNSILFCDRAQLRVWDYKAKTIKTLNVEVDNYFKYCTKFQVLLTIKNNRIYVYSFNQNSNEFKQFSILVKERFFTGTNDLQPLTCLNVLSVNYVISGGANGEISLWNFNKLLCTDRLRDGDDDHIPRNRIVKIKILSDSDFFSVDSEGCIRKYSVYSDEINQVTLRRRFVIVDKGSAMRIFSGFNLLKSSIVKDPDTNEEKYYLKVWDLNYGKCAQVLAGHQGKINCIMLIPDGYVLTCSDDCTMKVWDLGKNSCVRTIKFDDKIKFILPYDKNNILDN